MKKHIAEDLPARKYAPAAAGDNKKDDRNDQSSSGPKTPEQRVKQAVYDIRYRARREEIPLSQAYSQYMQNSSMGQQERTLVKQKLFGKSGSIQAEDFSIKDFASTNVADALYKVFVEGVKQEEPIILTYMEKLETAEHRKYKVRVTDKNGRSYVRYATREKISSLRANPNIESVEMTGYGEPYEGEKVKGERTSAAKAGKDWDGDGKVESGAKEYRGVVHNAIQRKRGGKPDGQDTSNVKEEFLGEINDEKVNPDANKSKIDVMNGKNVVKINPEVPGSNKNAKSFQYAHYELEGSLISEKALSQAQQKFMGMVLATKRGKKAPSPEVEQAAAGMTEKEAKKFAKTKHAGLPVHKEENECEGEKKDNRGDYAKSNVLKNKIRAATGIKNPIVMVAGYEPDGEMVDEARAEEKRGLKSTGEQRRRQKSGEEGPIGKRPVTSFSGGQNPHLRGKNQTKEQRRQSSRRYVDQPGGIYGEPENKQGARRYAKMQARRRDQSHMHSRFD